MRAAMRQESGLPGSPSTRMASRRPNSIGLPGRTATFQKSSVMPRASSAGLTRSRSPTDAPPMVTSTSTSARGGELLFEILDRVGGDAEQLGLGAEARDQRGEAIGVRRYDLPGARLAARLDQLIAGRQDGDARRPANVQLRMPAGSGERDGRGVEQAAGAQEHVACAEVAARNADVGAGIGSFAHGEGVAATLGVLLDHHRVGALAARSPR